MGYCLPPSAVRSIRDLIFWQYAKIISESAGAKGAMQSFGIAEWTLVTVIITLAVIVFFGILPFLFDGGRLGGLLSGSLTSKT